MVKINKIKSCPFCGGAAKRQQTRNKAVSGDTIIGFYVICTNCGCRTLEQLTPGKALRIWNRRAT